MSYEKLEKEWEKLKRKGLKPSVDFKYIKDYILIYRIGNIEKIVFLTL